MCLYIGISRKILAIKSRRGVSRVLLSSRPKAFFLPFSHGVLPFSLGLDGIREGAWPCSSGEWKLPLYCAYIITDVIPYTTSINGIVCVCVCCLYSWIIILYNTKKRTTLIIVITLIFKISKKLKNVKIQYILY